MNWGLADWLAGQDKESRIKIRVFKVFHTESSRIRLHFGPPDRIAKLLCSKKIVICSILVIPDDDWAISTANVNDAG